ncbi:class I SAM-dependent methyltransferase [bacterium]|nr:class I SAM-dependent methyltransferase [bacterium]
MSNKQTSYNDPKLLELLDTFADLYWLKPFDIPWDAFAAYNVYKRLKPEDVVLDFGCGDGIFTALMLGARLPIDYDRFTTAKSENQKIGENQSGDIYDTPDVVKALQVKPERRIACGLELKDHHIKVAQSLGFYDEIIEGSFEKNNLQADRFDKVISLFAFYWASDINAATATVQRVLKKNGEFLVVLPSEHLHGMHLTKKLAEELREKPLKQVFEAMDGGRRALTSRYSRSVADWKAFFSDYKFETLEVIPTVNKLIFFFQDIAQRVFIPSLIEHTKSKISAEDRASFKTYLCKKVYPEFLKAYYEGIEGNPEIDHAYYLFRLKKA